MKIIGGRTFLSLFLERRRLMFANVIVNVPSSQVDHIFEYEIPQDLEQFLHVGSRIKIPFGDANRLIHGFVIDIHQNQQYAGEVKQIIEVPDLIPVINQEQLKLAYYLKETTFSPLVRILNAMIPEALKMKTLKYLKFENIREVDAELVMAFNGQATVSLTKEIIKTYGTKIKRALDSGQAEIVYDAIDDNKLKYQKVYRYKGLEALGRKFSLAPKIIEILSTLKLKYDYEKTELIEEGLNDYQITKLVKLGILKQKTKQKSRIKKRTYDIDYSYYFNNISKEAKKFYETSKTIFAQKKYESILWVPKHELEIIQGLGTIISENIHNNKQTLIVVPEILTSFKITNLLLKYLGLPVLCVNSEISIGENYENYLAILKKEYLIIVTTPLGVLWPYQDIGTIIVLDEDSDNYYNDQSPRYDVKEVMKQRANYHQANLIFESFTPDLEYYSRAFENKIKLIENQGIIMNNQPSDVCNVQVIDMTEELKSGNISPISRALDVQINRTMKNQLVTLLILNNKGYSDFVICRKCGHVEKCQKCQISYKYRKKDEKLYCPACGLSKPYSKTCSNCGSNTVKFMGYGAERLKEYLESTYQDAKVLIVDNPKYKEFNNVVHQIAQNNADIIIASDIYSRGFPVTNIGLVGIMALDLLAKAPGIKANQKVYSMLSNAKNNLKANQSKEMYIQTYNPKYFVLEAFVKNDYLFYYRNELKEREALFAPPYYHWNRILVKGKYEEIFKESYAIRQLILSMNMNNQEPNSLIIIGPVYNYTEKGAQLIIKHRHLNLLSAYQDIYQSYQNSNLVVIIDMFPKTII